MASRLKLIWVPNLPGSHTHHAVQTKVVIPSEVQVLFAKWR